MVAQRANRENKLRREITIKEENGLDNIKKIHRPTKKPLVTPLGKIRYFSDRIWFLLINITKDEEPSGTIKAIAIGS